MAARGEVQPERHLCQRCRRTSKELGKWGEGIQGTPLSLPAQKTPDQRPRTASWARTGGGLGQGTEVMGAKSKVYPPTFPTIPKQYCGSPGASSLEAILGMKTWTTKFPRVLFSFPKSRDLKASGGLESPVGSKSPFDLTAIRFLHFLLSVTRKALGPVPGGRWSECPGDIPPLSHCCPGQPCWEQSSWGDSSAVQEAISLGQSLTVLTGARP
jgi:hypothetical protein